MNTDVRPCIIDDIIKAALAAGGNMIWHQSPCQGANEIEIQNLKITTALSLIKSSCDKEFFPCLKTSGGKGEKHPVLPRGSRARGRRKEISVCRDTLLVNPPCNPPNKLMGTALI